MGTMFNPVCCTPHTTACVCEHILMCACVCQVFFCVSVCLIFFLIVLPSWRTDGFCGAEHMNVLAQNLRPNEVDHSRHHLSSKTLTYALFLSPP